MRETLTQHLEQRQTQKLSPQQVRFVRMLEMTAPEMEEMVRRELDTNPALERVDDAADTPAADNTFDESAEQMQLADYRGDDIPTYRLEARNHSASDTYREPVAVAGGLNLMDYLMEQLAQTSMTADDTEVARYIVGNLDDNGYLTRPLRSISDDLAFNAGIDISPQRLGAIFNAIRALDPAGIGAVDLRDCLLLQLRRRASTPSVDLATEIINNYYDLFSKMHFDRLRSTLGIDEDTLRDAIDVIRTLNPKPGSAYDMPGNEDAAQVIVPDFNIDVDGDNITLTLLNNIPDLQVERTFATADDGPANAGAGSARQRQALTFMRECRNDAEAFIRMLRMRSDTLFAVMSAIVKLQRDFFLTDDPRSLHPMILKDVAAITGYDLSVISRATAGKYVATRSGVYPLKFFFNERPKEDDDSSAHEIMDVIRELIENEDHRHPMSDNELTAALNGRGYELARRTVAKYRERLGIPVARLRRKL